MVGHAVRGDLGKSLLYHYDVMQEIGKRLPVTLYLGLASFAIGCIVGPFLGVVSAVRRGKWLDSLVTVLANVGITAPSFWIGVILIYVFGLYLRLLPTTVIPLPLITFLEKPSAVCHADPRARDFPR